MTPETLKLYEKLQPLFREKMGPLRSEDIYICEFCRIRIVHDEDNAHDCCGREPNNDLRLPLSIDSVNPERGLEGMLNGAVTMHRTIGTRDWCVTITTEHTFKTFLGDTPTEALLRALCEQEGV